MGNIKPDDQPVILPVVDRNENVALVEPLRLSADCTNRTLLADLALELAKKSASLRTTLPQQIRPALASLVRNMNCYYSNLIEGHDTHPVNIERALINNYDRDKKKRDLQQEAKAHVLVQAWIDGGGLESAATNQASILEIHKRFCENLPSDLLLVTDPDSDEKVDVIPGELRKRGVKVGRHIAISPGAVPRFLARYEDAYSKLGVSETVIAAAASHHRLLWIHPFGDGNGRVARLVSYAQLLQALETGGVWSIARGLARNVDEYKRHLAACDEPRWNDLDGRGNLSERALFEFSEFFLRTCIDQVDFMSSLIQPNTLRERILFWAAEEARLNHLPVSARVVLEAILYRGELARGDVPGLLGLQERQSRRVVSALLKHDVLIADSDRAPLRLHFPAALASRWMPGLFPSLPR